MAPTTLKCSGSCGAGWTEIDCNCYKFEANAIGWQEARIACDNLQAGAGLVSITSAELQQELITLSGKTEFWTGGNDLKTQKVFVWDLTGTTFYNDGETIGYNNWYSSNAATQPNHNTDQDCVKLKLKLTNGEITKLGWDDINCDSTNNYICQFSVV